MVKKISLLFLIALAICSCASPSKIVYFQKSKDSSANDTVASSIENFETKIKSDDALMIIVSSPVKGAADAFNLPAVSLMDDSTGALSARQVLQQYLVDRHGEIIFPILGNMELGGLTEDQAIALMKEKLKVYINEPLVNLRILNYKVSVMGEVMRPNSYGITTERMTLPEALSLAGDMTIYGDRKNITVIRETDGVKTFNHVDITRSDMINSPYYYVSQNDVIYVSPNKTKVNSSVIGPNLTVAISAVSLLITVVALLTR